MAALTIVWSASVKIYSVRDRVRPTIRSTHMTRHPENRNLRLHYEDTFHNLPVLASDDRPLVANYLETMEQVIDQAMEDYSRVFVFRLDLRFPYDYDQDVSNNTIRRFLDSFTAKLEASEQRRRSSTRVQDNRVRYLWAREQVSSDYPHYHLAILLNGHAYRRVGSYMAEHGLARAIKEAWVRALELDERGDHEGLVSYPRDSEFILTRDDERARRTCFSRLSYLCKVASKRYGDRSRNFGCSIR